MPALLLKLSLMLTLVMTTCPRLQPEPLTPMPALLSKLDLMLTLRDDSRGTAPAFNAHTDARALSEAQSDAYAP